MNNVTSDGIPPSAFHTPTSPTLHLLSPYQPEEPHIVFAHCADTGIAVVLRVDGGPWPRCVCVFSSGITSEAENTTGATTLIIIVIPIITIISILRIIIIIITIIQ